MQYKKTQILLPLVLTLLIVLADQITKALIVQNIPPNTIGHIFFDGFFRIIHVKNLGIAFSMGDQLKHWVRVILFIILPLSVMAMVVVYYFKSNEFTLFQRWMLALILGGGFGNLIDRIFRPDGVVDFLDFRFYGIFGFERFPTFNIADSSIVVGGILLIAGFLIQGENKSDE